MKTATSVLYPLILCVFVGFTGLAQAEPASEHGSMAMQGGQKGGDYRGGHGMLEVSDEQRAELDRIKADYAKKQAPLKARFKALKVELMAMALADTPDNAAIDKKIDEMLELKRQILRNKVDKVSAKRKVLDDQQRAQYDLRVMKKAARGGGRDGGHAGGGMHGMEHGKMGGQEHGMRH